MQEYLFGFKYFLLILNILKGSETCCHGLSQLDFLKRVLFLFKNFMASGTSLSFEKFHTNNIACLALAIPTFEPIKTL